MMLRRVVTLIYKKLRKLLK
ncbi:hypothetical protein Goklo_028010 [Gossypium klotzschianum]|uniref:Uncharacterized protein n=1 Tax=Gossypium klotzschianum TaxID=34286 RepID=A0A7J8TZT1_9ROSI|nr:hypothetical protein [Gossypium klotzschianum]